MSSFRSYQQSSHGYQPDSHRNSREITWPDGSSAGVVQQPEVNQRTFLRDLVSGVCKGVSISVQFVCLLTNEISLVDFAVARQKFISLHNTYIQFVF